MPPKYDTHIAIGALAMSAPGIRMVAVDVMASREGKDWYEGEHEVTIYPVLALLAKTNSLYRRPHNGQTHKTAPTHEGMESLGWTYSGDESHLEFDAVICHEEFGPCDASFALGDVENSDYKIVPAPWPPEEDRTRLHAVIEELRTKARAKVTSRLLKGAE